MQYIGRFSPSPTGPLHFGSMVAAVASYCDAKAHEGKWLVRMEDIDKPREMSGAADDILRTLESFGFAWDGEIVYQSQRSQIYEETFARLQAKNFIYPCTCTRKEIADSNSMQGIDGLIYPKTCFLKDALQGSMHAAYRVIAKNEDIIFFDTVQGEISQNLARDIGDFILKRKDGFFAYQLAVVVDDAAQGVTHIVRGADLLDSTPRQIYLQQLLGIQTPHYAHVPVATNAQGEKLSKQKLAPALDCTRRNFEIFDVLSFLGQHPPEAIKNATLDEVWRWAICNWQLANVPKSRALVRNHT